MVVLNYLNILFFITRHKAKNSVELFEIVWPINFLLGPQTKIIECGGTRIKSAICWTSPKLDNTLITYMNIFLNLSAEGYSFVG